MPIAVPMNLTLADFGVMPAGRDAPDARGGLHGVGRLVGRIGGRQARRDRHPRELPSAAWSRSGPNDARHLARGERLDVTVGKFDCTGDWGALLAVIAPPNAMR